MTKPASGIGQSQCVFGASCQTATRKSASEAAQKRATCARDSWPLGSSRVAVRGLRASIAASISRLSAIASDRAPTIASVIQTRSCADGVPPIARKAPTYANGSAKTVCSILTSRANRAGSAASVGAEAVTPACYAVSEPAPSRLRHDSLDSASSRVPARTWRQRNHAAPSRQESESKECPFRSVALLVRDVDLAAEQLEGMRKDRAEDFVAVPAAAG